MSRQTSTTKVVGKATGKVFTTAAVPAGQKLWLTYRAFLDVESNTGFDVLTAEITATGKPTIAVAASKASLGTWTLQKVDITALANSAGVQVKFNFDSIDCINNAGKGVFVDDVMVQAGP